MMTLFEKHQETLRNALDACQARTSWSAFAESPSKRIHGDEAASTGKLAFEAHLGKAFLLDQPGECGRVGAEVSPYDKRALGITYPRVDPDLLCSAAQDAMRDFRKVDVQTRTGLCIALLRDLESHLFENAYATMHTAGQSFMLAFVGSGANALDRGLEAVVYAHKALTDIPAQAHWTKSFGPKTVSLDKRYHLVPRGIALVMCCASFPAWNAYPAIMANLMTGNPVVVKPHPSAILPMALAVRSMRAFLHREGFDPNLITLAADSHEAPIAEEFLSRDDVAIVDFTGSQRIGRWIETSFPNKQIYTETSGVNSIVLESTDDLKGMIDAIAHSLCLFSAQMCTSPQNLRIAKSGIQTPDGPVTPDDFAALLAEAIDAKVASAPAAAGLCGALQSEASLALLERLHASADSIGKVVRPSSSYVHPDFPEARTATPLVILAHDPDSPLLREEHFAPVCFVIVDATSDDALTRAANDAGEHGAIATHVYSCDSEFLKRAEELFVDAGASFSCNLIGPMALNFAAAYSDLHVTGLNAAGNACLTDLAFVANRFRRVQVRWPTRTDCNQPSTTR